MSETTQEIIQEALKFLEASYQLCNKLMHASEAERELAKVKLMMIAQARKELGLKA